MTSHSESQPDAVEVVVEDVDSDDHRFDISAQELQTIMDERDTAQLAQRGGPIGLARALRVEIDSGIASASLELHRALGENVVPRPPARSYLSYLCEAASDFIILLLIGAAIVSVIVWVSVEREHNPIGWIESLSIILTVMLVLNLNAYQDWSKHRKLNKLEMEGEKVQVTVVRDGCVQQVLNHELLVGDIVRLNVGDILQADGILIRGCDVECDESALTGEALAVKKAAAAFMLSGSAIQNGQGSYLVVAVGVRSQMGQIQVLILGKQKVAVPMDEEKVVEKVVAEEETGSPLQKKLFVLAKLVSVIATILAALALIGMALRFSIPTYAINKEGWKSEHTNIIVKWFITAITIMIVAIPEGLPLAVSLALSLSIGKMLKQHNLVKVLSSTETMGSATTICSDKTGTLTQNRMTVVRSKLGKNSAQGDTCGKELAHAGSVTELVALNICLNRAEAEIEWDTRTNRWAQTGNKTDCALLAFAHDMGYEYRDVQTRDEFFTQNGEERALGAKVFPFSSARKRAGIIVPHDGGYRLYLKGAPEMIFALCTRDVEGDFDKDAALALVSAYARDALRTIAFAYRDFASAPAWDTTVSEEEAIRLTGQSADTYTIECDLTFCGIVGIEDPIRPTVPPAIKKCNTAGVDVRMVTGDNIETAIAIAKQCGIIRPEIDIRPDGVLTHAHIAMTGPEFRHRVLDPYGVIKQEEFDKVWPYLRVLARSSPMDKHTLVTGMQQSSLYGTEIGMELGLFPDRQVVAVTGDGTNDAPALQRADIGFAMGITGTSVAKDAADIILLDDDFASIVTACLWGRNVYDSIAKFLQFQLTVNVVAVSLALVGAFAFSVSPLSTVQMLWVNVVMDSLGALSLASEPPDEKLLLRPPYGQNSSLLSKYMLGNIFGQSLYQLVVLLVILFAGAGVASPLPIYPTKAMVEAAADSTDLMRKPGGIFYLASGNNREEDDKSLSIHYSFIFNVFVLMQFANWINARKLYHEWNVFHGLHRNRMFIGVWLGCMAFQVFLVEIGNWIRVVEVPAYISENTVLQSVINDWELRYFNCNNFVVASTCLPPRLWGYSFALGAGSLLWQPVIVLLFKLVFRANPEDVVITKTVTVRPGASAGLHIVNGPTALTSSGDLRGILSTQSLNRTAASIGALMPRNSRVQTDLQRNRTRKLLPAFE